MLLHVVETAGPVYVSLYPVAGDALGQNVSDALAFVDDVSYVHSTETSGVTRLASSRRVKSGAVEVDPPAIFRSVDDGGFELVQVRVGVVEPQGHGNPESDKEVSRMLQDVSDNLQQERPR